MFRLFNIIKNFPTICGMIIIIMDSNKMYEITTDYLLITKIMCVTIAFVYNKFS